MSYAIRIVPRTPNRCPTSLHKSPVEKRILTGVVRASNQSAVRNPLLWNKFGINTAEFETVTDGTEFAVLALRLFVVRRNLLRSLDILLSKESALKRLKNMLDAIQNHYEAEAADQGARQSFGGGLSTPGAFGRIRDLVTELLRASSNQKSPYNRAQELADQAAAHLHILAEYMRGSSVYLWDRAIANKIIQDGEHFIRDIVQANDPGD